MIEMLLSGGGVEPPAMLFVFALYYICMRFGLE